MIPNLYKPDADIGEKTGWIGALSDTVSCQVTEERNGAFELEMTYPVGGELYDKIKTQCLIEAKVNDTANNQYFRIYKITKPISRIVTIFAEHISYELAGNPVLNFEYTGSAGSVLSNLLNAAVFGHNFSSASDIVGDAHKISFPGVTNVRAVMGGNEGSILDTFGGEYEFNNYQVYLHSQRGRDNGITVEYGKNLTDLTQEEAIDSTYTCIVPYAKTTVDGVDSYHFLSDKFVNAPNADKFARPKALPVDFSDKFQEGEDGTAPTITDDALQEYAEQYIEDNNVGVPSVSLDIKFVALWKLPEYADNPLLERVGLCDLVTVRFPALGVDAKAKVIKIVYDTLRERVTEATLGDAKSSFVDSYAQLEQKVSDIPQSIQSIILGQIDHATNLITGAKGGHVVIKLDNDKKPQEILIMDTENINTAVKVWRWNINGFGYSSNGINGPYETAITMDGHILGKFIYALSIYGNQIIAGAIKSVDGNIVFDLDGNALHIYDSKTGKDRMQLDREGLSTFNEYGQLEMQVWNRAIDFFEDSSATPLGWIGWAGNKNTEPLWEGWGFNTTHCDRAVICYDSDDNPGWESLMEFRKNRVDMSAPLYLNEQQIIPSAGTSIRGSGQDLMLSGASSVKECADGDVVETLTNGYRYMYHTLCMNYNAIDLTDNNGAIIKGYNDGLSLNVGTGGYVSAVVGGNEQMQVSGTITSVYNTLKLYCNVFDLSNNGGAILQGYSDGVLRVASGSYIALVAGGSDRVHITSGYLDVYNTPRFNCHSVDFSNNGGAIIQGYSNSIMGIKAGVQIGFVIGGSDRAYVDAGGIHNASDRRMKQNIKDSDTDALGVIDKIKFKQFEFKDDPTGYHFNVGMIAQDLQEIDSSLVGENRISKMLAINDTELLQYALKAIQQLSAKVDGLEAEIKELKSNR